MVQYTIIIDERARRDIREARRWYHSQGAHLAIELANELVRARRDLQEAPLRWSEWRPPTRRLLLRKYPYALFYRVFNRQIIIVALLHQQRDVSTRFPEDP